MQTNPETMKKVITQEAFNKKVEIEMAHLEYFDRMSREEAIREARVRISAEYEVQE